MAVKLYVYDKATLKVVAVIEGACAASCEHEAGLAHCNDSLGWSYSLDVLHAIPVEGQFVDIKDPEGNFLIKQPVFKTVAEQPDVHEMTEHTLELPSDVQVIQAPKYDMKKAAGAPGGPRIMTLGQIRDHLQRTERDLMRKHGHKVMTVLFVLFGISLISSAARAAIAADRSNSSISLAVLGLALGVFGVMLSVSLRNTRANALTTALGASATVRAYNGTPPANPDTALSGNTLLAQGTYAATPYPGAASATMTSNAITGANAAASGTPTFYRTYASDGTTCVAQHNTTDFVVTPAALTSGVAVSWAAIVHTEALGT